MPHDQTHANVGLTGLRFAPTVASLRETAAALLRHRMRPTP